MSDANDQITPVLTVCIPVYNEAENIGHELNALAKDLTTGCFINIIYDFEEDNTLPAAREAQKELGLSVGYIRNKYGRGVLNAIKTGLESAQTKYVIVTMADLSDPPAIMNRMLELAEKDACDIVCASRYMKGGRQDGGPFFKGLMSRFAGLSLHYLGGVPTHDATNSFKLYRKSFLDKVVIESTGGFELGLELVVKAHLSGHRVGQVPTIWTDREAGKSNFKLLKWLPKYLKWYFVAMLRLKQKLVS